MKYFITSILFFMCSNVLADVAVIVHPSNAAAITPADLEQIFMVKNKNFAGGSKATVYYLAAGDATRTQFDDKVLRKSSSQLKAYWSKLVFTGKGTPPAELPSSAEAVAKVAADPSGIAYVDKSAVNDNVKVVTTIP
jgi:ABC-type phosphate transport system substrate-binding protein